MESDAEQRCRVDLSHGWAFVKQRMSRAWLTGARDAAAERVDLPHCWNTNDVFRPGSQYYRGFGSYRRLFRLPRGLRGAFAGRWSLRSEGFYGLAEMWLNGRPLGRVDGAYLGMALDVQDCLLPDAENLLGVRVTNRCPRHVLPGLPDPDFVLYGGLSGRIWLEAVPGVSLSADRVRILTNTAEDREPEVEVSAEICNGAQEECRLTLAWQVVDTAGVRVSEIGECAVSAPSVSMSAPVSLRMPVPGARAWSTDAPFLYVLTGELRAEDGVVDAVRIPFGFRTAEFREGRGFFLNGRRTVLRGCNRHESMPGFGRALPARLQRGDALLLKNAGFNFVRLSHYPQSPAFLDACDELGLLVYAEIATWKRIRPGRWLRAAQRQMERLVRRDRNRPSVIVWGMGNEGRSRRVYAALKRTIRALDGTRPATYAENHFHRAVRARTAGLPDVWSTNYEVDRLAELRDASPSKCVIISECANAPHALRGTMEAEEAQVRGIEAALAAADAGEHVCGYALWSFNDYATMRKKRYARHCGLWDAWRLPKMSVALMTACQTRAPFVALFGNWGEQLQQEVRQVHVFTNCGEVVLRVGGREAARIEGVRHAVCRVPYGDGALVATGQLDGAQATCRLERFGMARILEVRFGESTANAERGSAAAVELYVLDAQNRRVADWNGEAAVALEGPARLASYRSDRLMPVAAGLGRTYVVSEGEPGRVVIRAAAAGLRSRPAEICLQCTERSGTGSQNGVAARGRQETP